MAGAIDGGGAGGGAAAAAGRGAVAGRGGGGAVLLLFTAAATEEAKAAEGVLLCPPSPSCCCCFLIEVNCASSSSFWRISLSALAPCLFRCCDCSTAFRSACLLVSSSDCTRFKRSDAARKASAFLSPLCVISFVACMASSADLASKRARDLTSSSCSRSSSIRVYPRASRRVASSASALTRCNSRESSPSRPVVHKPSASASTSSRAAASSEAAPSAVVAA